MKKSWIYDYGHIIRFVPIVNLIILVRFEILRVRGYFDRLELFLKSLVHVAIYVAYIVPTVLIASQFDPSALVKLIINGILFYVTSFIACTFSLQEEKKVRESGFFWTSDSK